MPKPSAKPAASKSCGSSTSTIVTSSSIFILPSTTTTSIHPSIQPPVSKLNAAVNHNPSTFGSVNYEGTERTPLLLNSTPEYRLSSCRRKIIQLIGKTQLSNEAREKLHRRKEKLEKLTLDLEDRKINDASFQERMSALERENLEDDPLTKVQQKLEEAKEQTLENIEKILARGDKIDHLLEKTERLKGAATQFYKKTKQPTCDCRCVIL